MKSRWGRVVNGVPREVPRSNPRGCRPPRVLAAGHPRGTPLATLHARLFDIMSFFGYLGQVKRDFFHCRQTQPVPTQCYVVEMETLVELNPNILVRCFQRMASGLGQLIIIKCCPNSVVCFICIENI